MAIMVFQTACEQKESAEASSASSSAQEAKEEATVNDVPQTATSPQLPEGRWLQMATLDSPEANNQFSRNVQIMQNRVHETVKMNELLDQENDPQAKKDIKKQIEEMMRRINEGNKLMAETYRYSLNQKYVRNIEEVTVFIKLTDEDVEAIKEKAIEDGIDPPASITSNLLSVCTLKTPQAYQNFQKDVARTQAIRDEAIQLQKNVDAAINTTDKAYAQGKLDVVMEQLSALNTAMFEAYRFSINSNYTVQVDKSSLYIWDSGNALAVAQE